MQGLQVGRICGERAERSLFLLLAGLMLGVAGPAAGQEPADSCAAKLKDLRKLSFLALAAPAGGKEFPEQRKFLSAVDLFLKQTAAGHEIAQAPAYYLRGRYFLQRKNATAARADFDAAIRVVAANTAPVSEAHAVPWFPTPATIRVFRAFTFLSDGPAVVLEKLEEIPPEAAPPVYHEVGELLNHWADQLGNKEQYDEAIRAYTVIARFHLWDDEGEDPARRIELLKIQRGNRQRSP